LKDVEIRQALHKRIKKQHASERDTLVVNELNICRGSVRADVVVINGILKAYEIKSSRDSLARLPVQASTYSAVFDYAVLVVAENHLAKALKIIPNWWGIEIAGQLHGLAFTEEIRPARMNPKIDPVSVAQLLWRDEVIQILSAMHSSRELEGLKRKFLWQLLADSLALEDLRLQVRECLKSRENWRAVAPQHANDDSYPLCARSLRFQAHQPLQHNF
jgi:hypothetical protein